MSDYLRILFSTSGVWRADVLAQFLSALDGLVTRVTAACLVSDLLRRYNEELSSLQAMGLLGPGVTPAQWGKSKRGTDALSREGYLNVVNTLRRHGMVIRQEHLGWAVDFNFTDIIEIVPRAQHLEVEFIQIASPGVASLIQTGSKVLSETDGFLRHIFNRWTEPEATRRLVEAQAEICEHQARIVNEKANQEALNSNLQST